jgi:hypothetical protein
MTSSVQNNQHHVFNSLRNFLISSSNSNNKTQSDDQLDVLAQAIAQASQTEPTTGSTSSAKEKLESGSIDTKAVETGQTVSYVETGPVSPEISPEVEGYLEEVRENIAQLPQEIVVADGNSLDAGVAKAAPQPVVVLPITQDDEEKGAKKNSKFSIRWLVEWSRKIMKMFAGQVVYQQDQVKT